MALTRLLKVPRYFEWNNEKLQINAAMRTFHFASTASLIESPVGAADM
jgi:hypothetical protein